MKNSLETLRQVMDSIDVDGDGQINYTEFLAATMNKKQYQKESACWNAFRVFDIDGSGTISMEELKHVLEDRTVEAAIGAKAVADVMADCDANGDGTIDFE